MTPPINTPLRITMRDGTVETGCYASINDTARPRDAVWGDDAKLNAPRWWRRLSGGELVVCGSPSAWRLQSKAAL